MLKRIPSSARTAAFLLLLATCVVQIGRSAFADPSTTPIAKDVVKSARAAVSRVGGPDVTAPLPEGGAGGDAEQAAPGDEREPALHAEREELAPAGFHRHSAHLRAGVGVA